MFLSKNIFWKWVVLCMLIHQAGFDTIWFIADAAGSVCPKGENVSAIFFKGSHSSVAELNAARFPVPFAQVCMNDQPKPAEGFSRNTRAAGLVADEHPEKLLIFDM
jgi:hypothetical protein